MKVFEKSRPRLLIISKETGIRDELVTLLTGYGYFVDYVNNREDGLDKFKKHKQAIVIIDVPSLPRYPGRMLRIFQTFKKNPIILIAAKKSEEKKVEPYLRNGVYDILHLPLNLNYVGINLRRLVSTSHLMAQNEFLILLVGLGILILPIWIMVLMMFMRIFIR